MRRTHALPWNTLWTLLVVLSLPAFAPAEPAIAPVVVETQRAPEAISNLLQRGHELELQRRWGEAMAHYEDAVRQFPEDVGLHHRFDYARMHFDLARRYNDRSFRSLLERLSVQEALDLYAEVLLKVQTHYVEAPNWKNLVERGTNDLEVALSEPAFCESCSAGVDSQAIDHFRQELRRLLGPQVVGNRAQACDAALAAGQLAQQRLGVPSVRVILEFICGAANTLDPYSTYLSPDQLNEVYSQIEGNFVGLGVELKSHSESLVIDRVISGSPAERSGLRAGDQIVAVDGQRTREISSDRAANLLQGPAGSTVQLTLVDPAGQTRTLLVRRERVEVPSVDDVRIVDRSQGIGYLRLTCFQKTTAHDLDVALWNLHQAGMRSLIMDLRRNPGGLLVASVEVADRFLERGTIVSTRGRNLQEDLSYSAQEPGTWRMPLIVLVDQDSASAAEIFAGAIRDHRRGTIVGRRSYGKGSVQGIFPLSTTGAGVRLTTAKFYSPTGRPYNRVGVEPDIAVHEVARAGEVPLTSSATADPILAAGLQAARQLTAKR